MTIAITDETLSRAASLRERLHESPEPSGGESCTYELVSAECKRIGLALLPSDCAVIAKLDTGGANAAIILHANIDAVRLEYPLKRPFGNAAHSRGNDWHIAALLFAAELIANSRDAIPHDVYFVFQPESETLTGAERTLRYIREFIDKPILGVFSLHNRPDLELGNIAVQSGATAVGELGFRASISRGTTDSGSPIMAAAQLINKANELAQNDLSSADSFRIYFRSIQGGAEYCRYPQIVDIVGGVNALSENRMSAVFERLTAIADAVFSHNGCRGRLSRLLTVPPIINDDGLAAWVRSAAQRAIIAVRAYAPYCGKQSGITTGKPLLEANDFGLYARIAPIFCVGVGSGQTGGGRLYDRHLSIDKGFLPTAAALYAAIAQHPPQQNI